MFPSRHASACAALLFLYACSPKQKQYAILPAIKDSLVFTKEEVMESFIDLQPFQQGFNQLATQRFVASPHGPSVIRAANGLEVMVNPAVLEKEDGTAVNGKITVNIIELMNSSDLFKSNAATVSNGKLLASGGSYYIGMTCDGKKLRIKKNNALQVSFPIIKNDEMELFYGERDSLQQMNWKRAGLYLQEEPDELLFSDVNRNVSDQFVEQGPSFAFLKGRIFRSMKEQVYYYEKKVSLTELLDSVNKHTVKLKVDTVSYWPRNLPTNQRLDTNYLTLMYGPRFQFLLRAIKEENTPAPQERQSLSRDTLSNRNELSLAAQIRNYYAPADITRLGWINCDRFYQNRNPANLPLDLPITFTNTRIEYFIIFKKFNGLMSGSAKVGDSAKLVLNNLPLNEPIKLIAFTKSNGLLYEASVDTWIGVDAPLPLAFKEISIGDMNKIFGRNVRM